MVIFYKKWKKYNEIQLTKNKMDLNIRKMTNHPPSPGDGKKRASTDGGVFDSALNSHNCSETKLKKADDYLRNSATC